MNLHEKWMAFALEQGKIALAKGEIPVGAVVVQKGRIIGRGHNLRESQGSATSHAEILAINEACRFLGDWRLEECDLYVTLEPCAMCAGAIINSRIRRVFFGAFDPAQGGVCGMVRLFDLPYAHRPDYEGGVLADPCAALLSDFFARQRGKG